MKAFKVLTVLLLLCCPAAAGDVMIEGIEKPVECPKFAALKVPVKSGDKVDWTVMPIPIQMVTSDADGTAHVAVVPGVTYSVKVLILNFDTKRYDTGVGVITAVEGANCPAAKPKPVPKPKPPKKPTPPKEPDPVTPTPGASLYFLIVRPDGPASAAFQQLMANPSWTTLRKQGHLIKDKTLTEAKGPAFNVPVPDGATLPVVVTLRVAADKKSSKVVKAAIPVPTTTEDILKLPEGVSP